MQFLHKVSQSIATKYGENLENILVVLPNKRSKLFFDDVMAGYGGSAETPSSITLDKWIQNQVNLEVIDGIEAYFEFYEAYKKLCQDTAQQPETFDRFLGWAGSLLADFEELDKQMIDTPKFFATLTASKRIELWGESLTTGIQGYLRFWEQMRQLYQIYGEQLLQKNKAYIGMLYKKAAQEIDVEAIKTETHKLVFVGFNALTRSELVLLKKLVDAQLADIFWNADQYYINDKNQEAGRFIRQYNQIAGWNENPETIVNQLLTQKKSITSIAVPQAVGEAKYMGELLQKLITHPEQLSKTAVILCNEALLFSVLGSLPPNVTQVNATVGYAVKFTPVFGLLQAWFKLQDTAYRLKKMNRDEPKFYFRDVHALLNHPYLSQICSASDIEKINNYLKKTNKVLLKPSEIPSLSPTNQALATIFTYWQKPSHALNKIIEILDVLCRAPEFVADALLLQSCEVIKKAIKKVEKLNENYNHFADMGVFKMLFLDVISAQKLPFEGTPLQGLQIMGLLEARAIDFENVIILSANEGTLPEGNAKNSLMPADIRQEFKLPNTRERDAIYAYNLYSLMQNAKNCYFLHSTETNNVLNGGEKSRFLLQIAYELCALNPNIDYQELTVSPEIRKDFILPRQISIPKTVEMLQKIDEIIGGKGISPTMLNSYVHCPLKFYLSYIQRAKPQNDASETIDSRTIGDILHTALEIIFEPYLGIKLTKNNFLDIEKSLPSALNFALDKHFKGGNIDTGKNYLIVKICTYYLEKLISQEAKKENLTVLALEKKIAISTHFDILGNKKKVVITGVIDRIDSLDGVLRIIDYKTGSFAPAEIHVETVADVATNHQKAKAFQLLHYAFLFYFDAAEGAIEFPSKGIFSGIYAFRKMKNEVLPLEINKNQRIMPKDISDFRLAMQDILQNIYDPNQNFAQTADVKSCVYCDFKAICNR